MPNTVVANLAATTIFLRAFASDADIFIVLTVLSLKRNSWAIHKPVFSAFATYFPRIKTAVVSKMKSSRRSMASYQASRMTIPWTQLSVPSTQIRPVPPGLFSRSWYWPPGNPSSLQTTVATACAAADTSKLPVQSHTMLKFVKPRSLPVRPIYRWTGQYRRRLCPTLLHGKFGPFRLFHLCWNHATRQSDAAYPRPDSSAQDQHWYLAPFQRSVLSQ
eukprot:SAG31_NODE_4264_length_3397_cov_2.164948_2_plen_218_part_00